MGLRKKLLIFGLTVAVTFSANQTIAFAENKWNPISSQDYIFGYTSSKYSCWSGTFNSANTPILQVYESGKWVDVAKGFVLPQGSDMNGTCETAYPIAIGYEWTFMNPAPPIGLTGSARYSVLYRQKTPDIVNEVTVSVTKLVPQVVTKTRDVLKTVEETVTKTRNVKKVIKIPYIATVMKNGKKTNVIKYKNSTKYVPETYTETEFVDKWVTESYEVTEYVNKEVLETQKKITPGYTSSNGNIMVYPSESAMRQAYSDLGNSLLCAFGFSSNCKK